MLDVYRAVVLMALAGCYSPRFANCEIQCTGTCPDSLQCDGELHVCRAPGTSCSGGGGDGGEISDGTSGSGSGSDPITPSCTHESSDDDAEEAPGVTITLNPKIPAGQLVVLTIAENASSAQMPEQVDDTNGHMFTPALSTATGATKANVAIYYMVAPAELQLVHVDWINTVTQVVKVDDWICNTPPTMVLTTNDTNNASAGSATDTGSLTLDQDALVVAAVATTTSTTLPMSQTAGFTQIDPES